MEAPQVRKLRPKERKCVTQNTRKLAAELGMGPPSICSRSGETGHAEHWTMTSGCTQSPDPDGELCAGVRPGSMPQSATDMGPALKECPVGWRDRQGNRRGSMSWLHGLLWLATRSICSIY